MLRDCFILGISSRIVENSKLAVRVGLHIIRLVISAGGAIHGIQKLATGMVACSSRVIYRSGSPRLQHELERGVIMRNEPKPADGAHARTAWFAYAPKSKPR